VSAQRINDDGGVIDQVGSISSSLDSDTYLIDCRDGEILVTASPIGVNPNLDIRLELLDDKGTVLTSLTSSPEDSLDATLSHKVLSKDLVESKKAFMIRVSPAGRGNPKNGGYSQYGSIGAYRMMGRFPAVKLLQPQILDPATAGKVEWMMNESVSWKPSQVKNAPSVFELSGVYGTEDVPAGCFFDSRTGEIRGVPRVSGVYRYLLIARNAVGESDAFPVEIVVRQKMLSPSSVEWVEGVVGTYQAEFGVTNLAITYEILPEPPLGLTFDTGTGVLFGTIPGGETYDAVIKASGNGLVAQGNLRLVGLSARQVLDSGGGLKSFSATGWTVDSTEWVAEQGQTQRSMVSDETPHGGVSSMRVETDRSGWMTFSWKVDSERGGDFLTFNVNGRRIASISGNRAWQEVNYFLPSGSNVIEWTYEKDESEQFGRDRGWVDAVSFGKRLTVLAQPTGRVVSEGESLTLTWSVTGENAAFEWYYKPDNGNERLIKSGARITSMNPITSVLTIRNVRPDIDGDGSYYAKIRSGPRTISSEPARVAVIKKSSVTPLQSVVAARGGMASFSVSYSGADDPVYQWWVAGVRVPGALVAPCIGVDGLGMPQVDVMSGPKGSTLRISNVTLPDRLNSASYPVRLEVKSKFGGRTVYQDARLEIRGSGAARWK
jgi:hypothetical protein